MQRKIAGFSFARGLKLLPPTYLAYGRLVKWGYTFKSEAVSSLRTLYCFRSSLSFQPSGALSLMSSYIVEPGKKIVSLIWKNSERISLNNSHTYTGPPM